MANATYPQEDMKEILAGLGIVSISALEEEQSREKFFTVAKFYGEQQIAGRRELVLFAEHLAKKQNKKNKNKSPFDPSSRDVSIEFDTTAKMLQYSVAFLNVSMNLVFALCNFLTLFVGLGDIPGIHQARWFSEFLSYSKDHGLPDYVGYGWNYLDAIGAGAIGIQQYTYSLFANDTLKNKEGYSIGKDREFLFCMANQATGIIIMGVLTSLAWMAKAGLFYLPSAISLAFTGFSFDLCMLTPCIMEIFSCMMSFRRIKALENEIKELTPRSQENVEQIGEQSNSEIEHYKDMLKFEYFRAFTHSKQAVSWFGCSTFMLIIPICSMFILANVTCFGIPAGVLVAAAFGAFVNGAVRQWLIKDTSFDDLAQDFMMPPGEDESEDVSGKGWEPAEKNGFFGFFYNRFFRSHEGPKIGGALFFSN